MKKVYIGVCMLFLSMSVFAQPGFIKAYDESVSDKALFQDMLIDNDTIVLYSIGWNDDGAQGIRFLKMDSLGQVLSSRMIVDTVHTIVFTPGRKKIIKTQDEGYAVNVGTYIGPGSPILIKMNHNLDIDFLQSYESDVLTGPSSLLEMPDGGFMLLCWEVDGVSQPVVIRTDKNGVELWRKSYGRSDVLVQAVNIKKLEDNSYLILAGVSDTIPWPEISPWAHAYFIKIDSLGNKQWEWESADADSLEGAYDCDILADGGMVCVGGSWEESPSSPGSYGTRPQIFKLDADFNLAWQHIYSAVYGTNFQVFRQMVKLPDNNYLATGSMLPPFAPGGYPATTLRGIHFKYSPQGDSLWMRRDSVYKDNLPTHNTKITGTGLLSSGSIISIGTADNATGLYGFMMKLSPNGCIDTLNCWPVATGLEIFDTRQALSVYPNPATDYIVLSKDEGFFHKGSEIEWIDGLGRTIKRVFPQGNTVRIDVGNWASGLYFYRYLLDGRELDSGRVLVER